MSVLSSIIWNRDKERQMALNQGVDQEAGQDGGQQLDESHYTMAAP